MSRRNVQCSIKVANGENAYTKEANGAKKYGLKKVRDRVEWRVLPLRLYRSLRS